MRRVQERWWTPGSFFSPEGAIDKIKNNNPDLELAIDFYALVGYHAQFEQHKEWWVGTWSKKAPLKELAHEFGLGKILRLVLKKSIVGNNTFGLKILFSNENSFWIGDSTFSTSSYSSDQLHNPTYCPSKETLVQAIDLCISLSGDDMENRYLARCLYSILIQRVWVEDARELVKDCMGKSDSLTIKQRQGLEQELETFPESPIDEAVQKRKRHVAFILGRMEWWESSIFNMTEPIQPSSWSGRRGSEWIASSQRWLDEQPGWLKVILWS